MRHQARRSATLIFAAALGAAVLAPVSATATTHPARAARAPASLASWGTAQEVPGLGALNQGSGAITNPVSCASVGNCGAGGWYTDSSGHQQAYVVSEVNGTWQNAEEVPGTAALNQGNAAITSMSCASAGNCSAGGYYIDSSGAQQAFVVSETNGTWQNAEEVPGTAALNFGGRATIQSLSCAYPGSCSAGGYFKDSGGRLHAFVVSRSHGTWQNAREVPGIGGAAAFVLSVSCGSGGNCSAGGLYAGSNGNTQAFVVSKTNGFWQKAEQLPGIAALDQGNASYLTSVSCASAGNCSAGGFYIDASAHQQAYVASEVNGVWQNAEEVPGTAALNKDGNANTEQVSCPSPGNCGAGGSYLDSARNVQAFVVSEVNGVWQNAEEVPGTAALNKDGLAAVTSLSCASAGNCSAGGAYLDGSALTQVFVASEVNGTWRKAEEVPGTAALNLGGGADIDSVSCATAGNCSAGGYYVDGSGNTQAFVVSKT